jgi:putative copper export protein
VNIPHTIPHAAVRWLDFVGLTTLIGTLAFRYLIVRPALLSGHKLDDFDRCCPSVAAWSILLLALTSVGDLVLRAVMMSGKALGDVWPALPVVLRQTHYGAVWTARVSLIGLLAMAWLLRARRAEEHSWFLAASFVAASLIALTTTLSGHAADWGDVMLPVLIDWVHLVAASTWIGGLFMLGFLLPRTLSSPSEAEMTRSVAAIAGRFSTMAACCAGLFLSTGIYNAWLHVASFSPLVSTPYGWTLLAKLLFVGLVLMTATVNRYYFVPLLRQDAGARNRCMVRIVGRLVNSSVPKVKTGDDVKIRRQFLRLARLEWMIAAAVLICTALLTQLPPARHIRQHEHRERHAAHHLSKESPPPRWPHAEGPFPLVSRSARWIGPQ